MLKCSLPTTTTTYHTPAPQSDRIWRRQRRAGAFVRTQFTRSTMCHIKISSNSFVSRDSDQPSRLRLNVVRLNHFHSYRRCSIAVRFSFEPECVRTLRASSTCTQYEVVRTRWWWWRLETEHVQIVHTFTVSDWIFPLSRKWFSSWEDAFRSN